MSKQNEDGAIASLIKSIDFYKDLPKGLAQPTYVGASLSTGFLIMLGTLIFYQITEFMSYQKTSEMLIDALQEDQYVSSINICRACGSNAVPLVLAQYRSDIAESTMCDPVVGRSGCHWGTRSQH